jgi:hypothetical protein
MNPTPATRLAVNSIAPPGLQTNSEVIPTPAADNLSAARQLGPRRTGYGLPCAKCKTYYAADLSACPVCKTEERVLPTIVAGIGFLEQLPESAVPASDEAALEEERERFLREFKSQVYSSHMQINAAASFDCSLDENHQGAFEPAAVCRSCYARLQERLDQLEAALHINLKDATQVVYDAVWSDPSDPSKTYQNAAQAVLAELRRRAGISAVLGPLQPLRH